MKLLVLISILALAASEKVLVQDGPFEYEPISKYYHETIGIKKAAQLKASEEAQDFAGTRIVGGSEATLGHIPHMGGLVITLTTSQTSVCGSSLISNNRAVTAAHCWWDGRGQASQFVVVLGSLTLFTGGTRIATNNVRMHPQWNPNTIQNDVAIIYLSTWVNYNNNIQAIALASGSNNFNGVWATAAGFGVQQDGTGISWNQRLHHVNLQVITNQVCQWTFGSAVIDSTLCVSGAGGRSTCSGDSGGPLETNVGGTRTLIGITSFGSAAGCQRNLPAAFARVTSFNAWINQNL